MEVLAQKQILIMMRACIDTEKLNGNVILIKYQCETNHTTAISDIWDLLKYSQISRPWSRVGFIFFSNIILILDPCLICLNITCPVAVFNSYVHWKISVL